ncbi:MAG: CDP-glycerol glycerophosphotransferase family protein [Microbacterium sp.]|jgi:CDP-glycerol glycerophosphotransferase (TagB/SpsB family)/glycosyltransferase involved in cell wall biosynthesis|nr:CDP-glycerol glycerophosphotransferase family protein [Microbacterium sp.]
MIRQMRTRVKRALASERIAWARRGSVRPDLVLYESFAGNGMLCNPEAIFRHLLADPEFAGLRHVWVLSDPAAIARFEAEFHDHPRVRFVHRGGGAYWQALSTAGYIINNATFPPAFGKRPGQIYLNTWHGTPLKLMGFDMPDGAYESANTLRNFLMADYLLAANPFMAETMYEDAYRLRNVFSGRIIEEGYPRVDHQAVTREHGAAVREELERGGIRLGDRRIVLYAPTWRGASFSDPTDDIDALVRQTDELQAALGEGVVVLLKTHQIVHARASSRPDLRRVLAPNVIPTNTLLGLSAALVTDYSSIFFDYLATGRPIAFLTPDADAYADGRGTYLPVDQLPGPLGERAEEVGAALRELLDGERMHPRYREWAERFVPFDDGGATGRVVDIVFRGRTEGRRVRPATSDGRRRLMMHLGGMRSNGITSSVLSLLGTIDHERYDVTAFMPLYKSGRARANQVRIHPAVRQVFRIDGMNGSKGMLLARRAIDWQRAMPPSSSPRWHERLWTDEWHRIFGQAEFDWVADFSGYSPFWANLLLRSPKAPRAIWLHNQMAEDRERTVAGRRSMHRSLGRVFGLYRDFDQLISVSPRLTELNRGQLESYAPREAFVTVRNLPDAARVLGGAAQPLLSVLEPGEETPDWLTELQRSDRDERWFVATGRLSPEKNHARLLRAFREVHQRSPRTRLLIIGGGPLRDDLQRLIAELGLEKAAFLAGARDNPFALMAAADCFVLSSVYEGQPMVVIEAALLDLPIVSTAFASATDALPTHTIHVVDQQDAALRDGMLAFLDGRVPPCHLQVQEYTGEVLAEFDAIASS